jgi:hypothetical protein
MGICWLGGPPSTGTLTQLDVDGRQHVLTSELTQAHDAVFDGVNFFIAAGRGAIYRVPATGGLAEMIYVELGLSHVAIDDGCLYWASARSITSVATNAAAPEP